MPFQSQKLVRRSDFYFNTKTQTSSWLQGYNIGGLDYNLLKKSKTTLVSVFIIK